MAGGALIGEGRWRRAAWTLLAASSAIYFLSGNEADNDLWWHVLVGRRILESASVPRVDHLSYTAAGSPWIDHEWLFHVIAGFLFQLSGDRSLWLAKTFVGGLTAWLMWRAVEQRTPSSMIRGVVMLLTLSVLARGFAIRPQVISYLGVAWLLVWLAEGGRDRGRGWRRTAVVALALLLWANLHGGFIAGLGILVSYAAVSRHPDRAGAWLQLAVCIAATCANPYGPALWGQIWKELSAPHPLTEWQPVALGDPAQWSFLMLLGVFAATLPFARAVRDRPLPVVLAVAVGIMALRQQRHTPLFALCVAAPLSDQIDAAVAWARRRYSATLSRQALTILALGALLIAAAQTALVARRLVSHRFHVVFDAAEYPVGAMRFVRSAGLSGNMAVPLDWGGYVLWYGAPEIKVSLDGRFITTYSASVVETNFDFFFGRSKELLERFATTLVLVPGSASDLMRGQHAWRLIYRDGTAELFARNGELPLAAGTAPTGTLPFP